MNPSPSALLLAEFSRLAREAGRLIMDIYHAPALVRAKADTSPRLREPALRRQRRGVNRLARR